MQITKRDVEIIRFINEFGFCEILQIERRFGLKKPRSYQVMKRLVERGLVVHERVFYKGHGIYFVTREGAGLTDLPVMSGIPKDNYRHQLAVIEVYFKLREEFPEAEWVGERRIKREKFMKGLGERGHLADGMLVFPDDRQVAIEVELTLKSKKRLEEIVKGYSPQFHIKEVWYYCSQEVIGKVSKIAGKIPYFKIYSLS